jgi:1-acyl-sn-glycerol-3-phosphate acyltransferase
MPMPETAETGELTRVERAALAITRFTNERALPKKLQQRYIRTVTQGLVRLLIARRVYVDGVDWLRTRPDRGVVLAGNHRSFFDMWVVMLGLYESGAGWANRMFFPVRSNFFYDSPAGVLVNYGIGGGVMYPPIFRDRAKAELNRDALDRLAGFLAEPGTVVGVHPEGTRGKGPDPYDLLPAQPGVGQIVLHARPIVVPVFVNGLPQGNIVQGIADTFRPNARRDHPVIICYGQSLDYSALVARKPRAALYKKCADLMRMAIVGLTGRERALRDACARGEITDDDPGWIVPR